MGNRQRKSDMPHQTYWHGSSSNRLDSILAHGLQVAPGRRVYAGHSGSHWEGRSQRSLDGVYLAVCAEEAFDHADLAARKFGGSPMLLAVLADERDALPDEDRLPVGRILRETKEELGISTDSDGHALLRRRWVREPAFRARVTQLATEIGHGWLLRAPHGMPADPALMAEIILSGTDRALVHLTAHTETVRLLGAARPRLPFPVPAAAAHVAEQEDRHLRMLDAVGRAYRHLALRASYGLSPREQTLRMPFDIGTEGDTRIAAALVADGGRLAPVHGELPGDADLARTLARNRLELADAPAAPGPR